jgi:hypothetical protein
MYRGLFLKGVRKNVVTLSMAVPLLSNCSRVTWNVLFMINEVKNIFLPIVSQRTLEY